MTKFSSIFLRYFILVTAIFIATKNKSAHANFVSAVAWSRAGLHIHLQELKSHFLPSPRGE